MTQTFTFGVQIVSNGNNCNVKLGLQESAGLQPFNQQPSSYCVSAGNSLGSHSGLGFTTYDADRDTNTGSNCAKYVSGGWWFHVCYDACLTCHYVTPGTVNCQAMSWHSISYCEALKSAKMLVRPL